MSDAPPLLPSLPPPNESCPSPSNQPQVIFRFTSSALSGGPASQTRQVFAFSERDLEYLASVREGHRGGKKKEGDADSTKEKPFHGVRTPVPFLLVDRGKLLNFEHRDEAEYTGNAASPEKVDALYYHAALIVRRPRKGRVCSLFRICKAVLSWHPEVLASASSIGISLPEEVSDRLVVTGRKKAKWLEKQRLTETGSNNNKRL